MSVPGHGRARNPDRLVRALARPGRAAATARRAGPLPYHYAGDPPGGVTYRARDARDAPVIVACDVTRRPDWDGPAGGAAWQVRPHAPVPDGARLAWAYKPPQAVLVGPGDPLGRAELAEARGETAGAGPDPGGPAAPRRCPRCGYLPGTIGHQVTCLQEGGPPHAEPQ